MSEAIKAVMLAEKADAASGRPAQSPRQVAVSQHGAPDEDEDEDDDEPAKSNDDDDDDLEEDEEREEAWKCTSPSARGFVCFLSGNQ